METHVRAILDSPACNICGAAIAQPAADREAIDCSECGSNRRVRSLIALLCQEMCGVDIGLSELPGLKDVRGLGMSDSLGLEAHLTKKFDYVNTFYHQPPRLDLTQPDEREFGRYDFIISCEIMEHIPPPVEHAFANLARLLKPDGVLVMTTPYLLDGPTAEHFPELHEYSLVKLGERIALVNRTRAGRTEVFENLAFHGGPGSTLEMRLFSLEALRATLLGAGFTSVHYCSQSWPEFGIEQSEPFSLPIAARKGNFRAPLTVFTEAYRYANRVSAARLREFNKQTADYQAFVDYHNTQHKTDQKEAIKAVERFRSVEAARWTRLGRRLGLVPRVD